jgi:hypothetical protein
MNTLIVVLNAGIKKNKLGKWQSTDLTEADDRLGAPGGRLRILAAKYLIKKIPDSKILVTGGMGYGIKVKNKNRLKVCRILKSELVDLGICLDKIIEEDKSNNTYQQLKNLKKIIKQRKPKKIITISNRYHLPRIKAFIDYVEELKDLSDLKNLTFVSAEDAVIKEDKNFGKLINESYASRWMKKRIRLEKNGIRSLKLGMYKLL